MSFFAATRSFLRNQSNCNIGITKTPFLNASICHRQVHSGVARSLSRMNTKDISPSRLSSLRSLTTRNSSTLFVARSYTRTIAIACTTVGLSLAFSFRTLHCDTPVAGVASNSPSQGSRTPPPLPTHEPPPDSSVNALELSFGTVCGICTGVFVKKGLRAVAFILGGLFVLAQYLASKQIIRVNWTGLGVRYEKTFSEGGKVPTVGSLWKRFMDFILADFPPRATFLAGFILGLRLG